jgi:hypothetical protein
MSRLHTDDDDDELAVTANATFELVDYSSLVEPFLFPSLFLFFVPCLSVRPANVSPRPTDQIDFCLFISLSSPPLSLSFIYFLSFFLIPVIFLLFFFPAFLSSIMRIYVLVYRIICIICNKYH